VDRSKGGAQRREVLKNFIVLEGLDGAGTTTQLTLLNRRLDSVDVPHYCTFEPTDGAVGRLIRDILGKKLHVHPRTLALLFAADRTEHIGSEGIRSHLERGELVICDRYLFSSLAYQSIGCGFEYVLSINQEFPLPEVLFYVETPPELCQRRRQSRNQLDLFDNVSFQEEAGERYQLAIDNFRKTSMKVCRLDGAQEADEIGEKIWIMLEELSIIKS